MSFSPMSFPNHNPGFSLPSQSSAPVAGRFGVPSAASSTQEHRTMVESDPYLQEFQNIADVVYKLDHDLKTKSDSQLFEDSTVYNTVVQLMERVLAVWSNDPSRKERAGVAHLQWEGAEIFFRNRYFSAITACLTYMSRFCVRPDIMYADYQVKLPTGQVVKYQSAEYDAYVRPRGNASNIPMEHNDMRLKSEHGDVLLSTQYVNLPYVVCDMLPPADVVAWLVELQKDFDNGSQFDEQQRKNIAAVKDFFREYAIQRIANLTTAYYGYLCTRYAAEADADKENLVDRVWQAHQVRCHDLIQLAELLAWLASWCDLSLIMNDQMCSVCSHIGDLCNGKIPSSGHKEAKIRLQKIVIDYQTKVLDERTDLTDHDHAVLASLHELNEEVSNWAGISCRNLENPLMHPIYVDIKDSMYIIMAGVVSKKQKVHSWWNTMNIIASMTLRYVDLEKATSDGRYVNGTFNLSDSFLNLARECIGAHLTVWEMLLNSIDKNVSTSSIVLDNNVEDDVHYRIHSDDGTFVSIAKRDDTFFSGPHREVRFDASGIDGSTMDKITFCKSVRTQLDRLISYFVQLVGDQERNCDDRWLDYFQNYNRILLGKMTIQHEIGCATEPDEKRRLLRIVAHALYYSVIYISTVDSSELDLTAEEIIAYEFGANDRNVIMDMEVEEILPKRNRIMKWCSRLLIAFMIINTVSDDIERRLRRLWVHLATNKEQVAGLLSLLAVFAADTKDKELDKLVPNISARMHNMLAAFLLELNLNCDEVLTASTDWPTPFDFNNPLHKERLAVTPAGALPLTQLCYSYNHDEQSSLNKLDKKLFEWFNTDLSVVMNWLKVVNTINHSVLMGDGSIHTSEIIMVMYASRYRKEFKYPADFNQGRHRQEIADSMMHKQAIIRGEDVIIKNCNVSTYYRDNYVEGVKVSDVLLSILANRGIKMVTTALNIVKDLQDRGDSDAPFASARRYALSVLKTLLANCRPFSYVKDTLHHNCVLGSFTFEDVEFDATSIPGVSRASPPSLETINPVVWADNKVLLRSNYACLNNGSLDPEVRNDDIDLILNISVQHVLDNNTGKWVVQAPSDSIMKHLEAIIDTHLLRNDANAIAVKNVFMQPFMAPESVSDPTSSKLWDIVTSDLSTPLHPFRVACLHQQPFVKIAYSLKLIQSFVGIGQLDKPLNALPVFGYLYIIASFCSSQRVYNVLMSIFTKMSQFYPIPFELPAMATETTLLCANELGIPQEDKLKVLEKLSKFIGQMATNKVNGADGTTVFWQTLHENVYRLNKLTPYFNCNESVRVMMLEPYIAVMVNKPNAALQWLIEMEKLNVAYENKIIHGRDHIGLPSNSSLEEIKNALFAQFGPECLNDVAVFGCSYSPYQIAGVQLEFFGVLNFLFQNGNPAVPEMREIYGRAIQCLTCLVNALFQEVQRHFPDRENESIGMAMFDENIMTELGNKNKVYTDRIEAKTTHTIKTMYMSFTSVVTALGIDSKESYDQHIDTYKHLQSKGTFSQFTSDTARDPSNPEDPRSNARLRLIEWGGKMLPKVFENVGAIIRDSQYGPIMGKKAEERFKRTRTAYPVCVDVIGLVNPSTLDAIRTCRSYAEVREALLESYGKQSQEASSPTSFNSFPSI